MNVSTYVLRTVIALAATATFTMAQATMKNACGSQGHTMKNACGSHGSHMKKRALSDFPHGIDLIIRQG